MEINSKMPLNALKTSKPKDNPKALDQAATEVEALFINEMLKVMRQSTPSMSGKGLGADVYSGMFDTELSKVLAQRGLGFKDTMVEQLKRASGAKDDSAVKPHASSGVKTHASLDKGRKQDGQDINNFDAALGVATQKVK
jgi:flagellar protein FlgJ